MENPCRYCTTETGRHAGCHGHCDKEQEYLTEYYKAKDMMKHAKGRFDEIRSWAFEQRLRKFHGR